METSLSITSVQESDKGVYQCVVTNGIGVAVANELLIAKSNLKRMDYCTVPQSIALFHYSVCVIHQLSRLQQK